MDRVQLSDGTNYPDAMTPCSDCDGFGVVSLEEWIAKHGTDVKEMSEWMRLSGNV